MLGLCLIFLALLSSGFSQSVDQTVQEREVGPEVVEAVIDRIALSCVFSNDKLMLRRLAKAESNDGLADWTFTRNGGVFYGGIWQISATDFNAARMQFAYFAPIMQHFGIDFSKARHSDLLKPLYSGIAASLKLVIKEAAGTGIPWNCAQQATYWMNTYIPGVENPDSNTFVTACGAAADCQVPRADIVLIMDESGSITAPNFDLVRSFVGSVVDSYDISQPGIHIGVIKYSTAATVEIDLGTVHTKSALLTQIQSIQYGGGGTRTDRALLAMHDMFQRKGRFADGVPQIAILLTDGQSNDQAALEQAVADISGFPYTVFSVGVTSGAVLEELQLIGEDPDCLHVYMLEAFTDMADFVKQIQQLACKSPAELAMDEAVEGDLNFGETIYFKIKVHRSQGGVTIKLKMTSGAARMFLSWRVRNPGSVIYNYTQTIDSTLLDGGELSIPWPEELDLLDQRLTETDLYGALQGQGLGQANHYRLEYADGGITPSGAPCQTFSIALIFMAVFAMIEAY